MEELCHSEKKQKYLDIWEIFSEYNHESDGDEDSEDVSDEDDDSVELSGPQRVILADLFKSSISNVRKICKLMRKSRKTNDCLQNYVKAEIGKGKKLMLDTRTRWNREQFNTTPLQFLTRPVNIDLAILV